MIQSWGWRAAGLGFETSPVGFQWPRGTPCVPPNSPCSLSSQTDPISPLPAGTHPAGAITAPAEGGNNFSAGSGTCPLALAGPEAEQRAPQILTPHLGGHSAPGVLQDLGCRGLCCPWGRRAATRPCSNRPHSPLFTAAPSA